MLRKDTKFYGGQEHIFFSDSNESNVYIKPALGQNLVIDGTLTRNSGGLYISTSSATTITDPTTWYKIAGTTTEDSEHMSNFTHTNGKLTYTGENTYMFLVCYSLSVSGDTNDIVKFGISKNSQTPDPTSVSSLQIQVSSKTASSTCTYFTTLVNGDQLEMYCMNFADTNSITASYGTLTVLGSF